MLRRVLLFMLKSFARLFVLSLSGWLLFSCSGQITPPLPNDEKRAEFPFTFPSQSNAPKASRPMEAIQVERLELYTLATFPVKVNAVINGTLSDCVEIIGVLENISGAIIQLQLELLSPPPDTCSETHVPFEMIIPLSVKNLPADAYMVDVGGKQALFELLADNKVRAPVWNR
jgi:hypothetical protein